MLTIFLKTNSLIDKKTKQKPTSYYFENYYKRGGYYLFSFCGYYYGKYGYCFGKYFWLKIRKYNLNCPVLQLHTVMWNSFCSLVCFLMLPPPPIKSKFWRKNLLYTHLFGLKKAIVLLLLCNVVPSFKFGRRQAKMFILTMGEWKFVGFLSEWWTCHKLKVGVSFNEVKQWSMVIYNLEKSVVKIEEVKSLNDSKS